MGSTRDFGASRRVAALTAAIAALIASGCSASGEEPRGIGGPADVPVGPVAGTGGTITGPSGGGSSTPNDPSTPVSPTPSDPSGGTDVPADGEDPMLPVGPERLLVQDIVVPAIPPGGEATLCMTKKLSNTVEEKVIAVRAHISPGSHHFIVDRSPPDVNVPVLTPCPGLAGTDPTRVLVAETAETVFSMPEGVAFTLAPNQNLTMELHYINYTGETADISGTIEFVLAPEGTEGTLQEAGMIFTGNPVIALLPGTQSTIEFFGVPTATPEAPKYVFAMTSHTHSLGTRSYIERVPTAAATNGVLLHEATDWAQPPMDEFDPPLVFDGSDGLRLRCDYNNTTPNLVTFGTRFADEMCFMWLYYYPNTGALF